MKRFWSAAEVTKVAEGFGVVLDAKPVRLPGGSSLTVPFARLADALAAEWNAVGEGAFSPADLPLTQLAGTAIERSAPQRAAIIDALIRYGMNDLLCYRAEAPELALLEASAWDPWLRWADAELGTALRTTNGVMPIVQPAENTRRFAAYLDKFDAFQLAGLGVIVPALGSLVLGLALAQQALEPAAACAAAELGALWQAEQWGDDADAAARRENLLKEVAAANRFMMLCRP